MGKIVMRENTERKLIKSIAGVIQEREFIYYILSVLDRDEDREKMIQYLNDNSGLTKQEISIKAMDIKQKR